MGLPGPGAAGTASGRAGMRQRTQTSAPRHRWSAAPGRRVSPHRTLAASARPLVRSLARPPRAHGAHAPAHSHALHTPGVAGPTPVPGSCGLSHPARAPPRSPDPSLPSALGIGDRPPSKPVATEAAMPATQQAGAPGASLRCTHTHIHRSPSRDTRRGGRGGAVPGAGTVAR